jgi:hypothetical protein
MAINNAMQFVPHVQFMLRKGLKFKPTFMWGKEKCEQTRIAHPLDPTKELVLENMWDEINLGFRPLGGPQYMFQ